MIAIKKENVIHKNQMQSITDKVICESVWCEISIFAAAQCLIASNASS